MTILRIPTSLPHPTPTISYWQTPPHPISSHRSTSTLPPSTQYLIIGSGITGASIAHKLLTASPHASVLLLEARTASSGATGRNGGHCRAGRYLQFKEYVERFGEDEALRMEKLEEENVKAVGDFVRKQGVECDLNAVETLDVFTDRAKWENALAALEARKKVLEGRVDAQTLLKHRVWSAAETREELLVPEGVGAVSFPAYSLSPYKLVCAILQLCLEKGLNLQTNTPVLAVERCEASGEWTVRTERGSVRAENVVLATNAWTSALYPPLREFLVPTRAQVVAMRPGSEMVGNRVLERTMGLECKVSGEYLQMRPKGSTGEGDLIFGGGRRFGTPIGNQGEQPILDDSVIHPRISTYLRHACSTYFGRENWGEDGEVLQEWTGIMGYTLDSQPVVGQAPGGKGKGLWVCVGFNGHGMALAWRCTDALVGMMVGKGEEVEGWLPRNYRLERLRREDK